ncbi:Maf family protein [Paenibacillus sp. GCM10012307]|uniref:dTTP/UTP pyrophosphatase n=1 Tax=Paenibacillus roseus TaxID=2798579 RepID=A0A934J9U6_9BACL|nr:Maf family protein [Paenibacillus roseus]MBJ6362923.1 septum formation inhibitor Maf [Paenibacillus roseus]
MKRQKIILASSSPRRQSLLQSLNLTLPVQIMASNVDESTPDDWSPAKIVEQLSLRKARAVRELLASDKQDHQGSLIIGADTIVVLNGEVMGKPRDEADARRMLGHLQGRIHEVYSAIACVDLLTSREVVSHLATRVHMKPLDSSRIERYVASGEPMDKAGAYAIQGLGATLVDHIDGCYFNVVGLSLSLLSDMLLEFDIQVI